MNDTATTEIYTGWIVGSVRGVEETGMEADIGRTGRWWTQGPIQRGGAGR